MKHSPTERRRRDAWRICFARPDHAALCPLPPSVLSDSSDDDADDSPMDEPMNEPEPVLRYRYLYPQPSPLPQVHGYPTTQTGLPLYTPPGTFIVLPPGGSALVHLHFAFSVPPHHIALVTPAGFQSAPWTFQALHFPPGDYPDLDVTITNPARVPFVLPAGQRVATLLVYSIRPTVRFAHEGNG